MSINGITSRWEFLDFNNKKPEKPERPEDFSCLDKRRRRKFKIMYQIFGVRYGSKFLRKKYHFNPYLPRIGSNI